MPDEIRKVPYKRDQPGRPKNVKVLGSEKDSGVEILGGKPRVGPVRILDSSSGDKAPPPEIATHDRESFEAVKKDEDD